MIDRYGSYVKAIVTNIIKPPTTDEGVEDVVSDVFLSLWNQPDQGRLDTRIAVIKLGCG